MQESNTIFPQNENDMNEMAEAFAPAPVRVGQFIQYTTERLMVEQVMKGSVWASDSSGFQYEVPFSQFDVIR